MPNSQKYPPPPIYGSQVWRRSQYGMSHSFTIRPQHLTEHTYFSGGEAFPRYFKVRTIFCGNLFLSISHLGVCVCVCVLVFCFYVIVA